MNEQSNEARLDAIDALDRVTRELKGSVMPDSLYREYQNAIEVLRVLKPTAPEPKHPAEVGWETCPHLDYEGDYYRRGFKDALLWAAEKAQAKGWPTMAPLLRETANTVPL